MSSIRYYYAVVDCDSTATASSLYAACDGMEFERTSNALDLRFIPDQMEFKHPLRDTASEVNCLATKLRCCNIWSSSSLQQTASCYAMVQTSA